MIPALVVGLLLATLAGRLPLAWRDPAKVGVPELVAIRGAPRRGSA